MDSPVSFAAPSSARRAPGPGRPDAPPAIEAPRADVPSPARPAAPRMCPRRVLDIAVSGILLVALSPLFLVLALLVKATSPGPVLYRQVRVGLERRHGPRRGGSVPRGAHDRRRTDRRAARGHGRPFEIVKFRTMVVDAEANGPRWSTTGDPRITPLGRVLRLTRLDETPQLWNVFRGDMSLLGPRPERPYFVEQFVDQIPGYERRLRVKPGITGLAQVSLAYDATLDDVRRKLDADLDWIEGRSWKRDLGIVLRTVAVVVTGRGAR